MSFLKGQRQFIVGFLLGGLLVFLLIRFFIFQEFSGLEAVGNDTYFQLKNELRDDLFFIPLLLGLLAFVSLVTISIMSLFFKRTVNETNISKS